MKKVILITAMTAISMGVMADERGPYFGVSTGFTMYEEDDSFGISSDTANILTLSLNAGYEFNEFVSIEGRIGKGLADGEMELTNGFSKADVDISVDYLTSAFVKFRLPNSSAATPYVLLGGTKGKLTAEFAGFSESTSESDSSYGVGVDLQMDEDTETTLIVEYVNYLDKKGAEVTGLNVGFIKRF